MSLPSDPPIGDGLPHTPDTSGFWKLTLGSIGVVYGDIGTSPLYALKEALTAASADAPITPEAVVGVVSLILWTLTIIVTIKYVLFLLRADNNGEGGTLTLMALALRGTGGAMIAIPLLGVIGASLFYGDAIITPAISVLSAVEGLKVVTPALEPYVVPLSLVILVSLFAVQRRGTETVAKLFGPITSIWFLALAVGGLPHIAANPGILAAINPLHGIGFMVSHGRIGFITLGAVFLAVTGAEALYADLGHFGRRPIQFAWIAIVFPALALNYLGQGASLLATPEKLENPFFLLYPGWATIPMIILATAATVIASQAVISGAFSLTQQAIQLGLLPRFEIRRTSETQAGQIYLPRINWALLVLVVLVVAMFRSSSALAAAYGVAVTGTMVITAIMAFIVVRTCWHWSLWSAAALIAPLFLIDLTFLSANLVKIIEGGWIPLLVGGTLITMMLTWQRGSRALAEKTRRTDVPLATLLQSLERRPQELRAPGTAVFLTARPETTPTALLHNLKHNKVLHAHNVIMSVETADVPRVNEKERVLLTPLSETFSQVTLRFGYMEMPNVPKALPLCRDVGWTFDIMQTSFFLSRRALKPSADSTMPAWQDQLFVSLARVADDAARYFSLPTDRVVEIGTQVAV
ncbi:MAG: potassium transporter Kup [Variibacter sp.]